MRVSGSVKRKALYSELHSQLLRHDKGTRMEVPFSKIIKTKRRFRADFYCPNLKAIIEVNGGQFNNGRHTRGGKGYETDLTKLNLAQTNGLKVIQFTYQMLERGEHLETIRDLCK